MSATENFEKKISGGLFRLYNEKLYKNKDLTNSQAEKYHLYYQEQVKKWPEDPRKTLLEKIKLVHKPSLTVADVGAGECVLANQITGVTSFDKYPTDETIIKAEFDKLQVEDKSFDIVVHSLSLMRNYISKVIIETNRVLKTGGLWFLCEPSSRIGSNTNFINKLKLFGFEIKECDTKNKFFTIFVFKKIADAVFEKRIPEVKLKVCLYRKR